MSKPRPEYVYVIEHNDFDTRESNTYVFASKQAALDFLGETNADRTVVDCPGSEPGTYYWIPEFSERERNSWLGCGSEYILRRVKLHREVTPRILSDTQAALGLMRPFSQPVPKSTLIQYLFSVNSEAEQNRFGRKPGSLTINYQRIGLVVDTLCEAGWLQLLADGAVVAKKYRRQMMDAWKQLKPCERKLANKLKNYVLAPDDDLDFGIRQKYKTRGGKRS